MEAERAMSSYEELVQDPIKPTLMSTGQSFFLALAPSLSMGEAKSGVNGPLTWGIKVSRLISMI